MAKRRRRTCPYCRETIKRGAMRCKHCRSDLRRTAPGHGGTCPFCREAVHPLAVRCKHCRSDLVKRAAAGCGCSPGGGVARLGPIGGGGPVGGGLGLLKNCHCVETGFVCEKHGKDLRCTEKCLREECTTRLTGQDLIGR